jgi:hypothetical protein
VRRSLTTGSQEQPEDGPHTGPKHVVALSCSYSDDDVFLTEYIYIYIHTLYSLHYCHNTTGMTHLKMFSESCAVYEAKYDNVIRRTKDAMCMKDN